MIAGDLLRINKKPCVLFICWTSVVNFDRISEEAENLSFRTRVLQASKDLVDILGSSAVPGDAVPSSVLSEWYESKFSDLKAAHTITFLFDPSVIVVGIIQELVETLKTVNRFDVARRNVLIPLDFVQSWEISFKDAVMKDDVMLVQLSAVSTPTPP